MKEYRILVSYEEQGRVTVKAESAKEAEKQVYSELEENGLENLDLDCTGREYMTHGEA